MGKLLNEDARNTILEKCQEFISVYLAPFNPESEEEKKVYVQLSEVYDESYGLDEDYIFVSLDIYTQEYLDFLSEYDFSSEREKVPLLSYHFDTIIKKFSDDHNRLIGEGSPQQKHEILIPAKLKRKGKGKYNGDIVLRCGEVLYNEVAISFDSEPDEYNDKIRKLYFRLMEINSGKFQSESSVSSEEGHNSPSRVYNSSNNRGNSFFNMIGHSENNLGDVSYDLELFRVGNANTSLITNTDNEQQLLVDCGVDIKKKNVAKYQQTVNYIQRLNPEYIIISHNHKDHYNIIYSSMAIQSGILGVQSTALKKAFMVPPIYGALNFQILGALLGKKLSYLTTNTQNYQTLLGNTFPNVYLELGNCQSVNSCAINRQSYYENDTGIIVFIKNHINVILPGDCSYDFWPYSVGLQDADIIVIPHHGGIVSMNNPYGHCNNSLCEIIVSSGYSRLYPSIFRGYNPSYDQRLFIKNKLGITSRFSFLETKKTNNMTFHQI